jgi:hypothetical protein
MKRIQALAGVLLTAVVNTGFTYASTDQAVVWLSSQQNPDGGWGATQEQEFIHTTQSTQALRDAGQRNSAYYKGITWLENHAAVNADYQSRWASVLSAHGDDVSGTVAPLLNSQNSSLPGLSGWGANSTYHQSPLDTALVLQGLSAASAEPDTQAAVDYLKSAQLSGAGWPLDFNGATHPYTTAVVVQALAPLRTTDPTLSTNIANGLNALSTSVVSTSPYYLQAQAALAALRAGDTSKADVWLTNLRNAQLPDGSWSDSVYDTASALQALATADGLNSATNQTIVNIPDANLQAIINLTLGCNAMDSIDRSELLRLTSLTAVDQGINDLTGLEWALNLTYADLQNNNISSTAPVDSLTQLSTLLLAGNPVANGGSTQVVPALPDWAAILLACLILGISLTTIRRKNGPQNTHAVVHGQSQRWLS